jgi:hypothetical protein
MHPTLVKALEYATAHNTTVRETASAIGIKRDQLYAMLGNHTRHQGESIKWPGARTATESEVPLELVRHVRNGHPYWEKRPVPMGAVGRGPSPPVPPAPSDAAERHHTAVGIAWRLDVRAGEVERLRVLLGLPTMMTDGEADAITRLLNPRTAPSPRATHTPPAHP